MIKLKDLLNEGVFDKGILKVVFLAGGPGSGKTYAARGLFGLPKKINLSYTGLKMVNYDSEFEKALNKFGFGTELDNKKRRFDERITNEDLIKFGYEKN